ncbi:sigma factor-like helix-turn-helix DNA-binding protein [soil metagenome]
MVDSMSDAMHTLTSAAGDENPLKALHAVAEMRAELDRHEAGLVRKARNAGMGWQMIATALGVSRQAVHKKYGRR